MPKGNKTEICRTDKKILMKITDLNDDCLVQILKYLNLVEQLNFALACERFRSAYETYGRMHYKKVNLESLACFDSSRLLEFSRIVGPYITVLTCMQDLDNFNDMMVVICEHSANIKNVLIRSADLKTTTIECLVRCLKDIREIELSLCKLDEDVLLHIGKLSKLQFLTLTYNFSLRGEYLAKLPSSLCYLNIYGSYGIRSEYFRKACSKLRNLKTFIFHCNEGFGRLELNAILEHMAQLESLQISSPFDVQYERLAHLPKLKHFELISRKTSVRTELLQNLLEFKRDQLLTLCIYTIDWIMPEKVRLIAGLHQLRTLDCSFNKDLDDALLLNLSELKNLEELRLQCCNNINGIGLLTILEKCHKLKRINMQGCENITSKFVCRAIESLKERTEPVIFYVRDSGVTQSDPKAGDVMALTDNIKLNFGQTKSCSRQDFLRYEAYGINKLAIGDNYIDFN